MSQQPTGQLRRLRHDTSDVEKFWIEEVKRVFAAWV